MADTPLEQIVRALADDPDKHHWAIDLATATGLGPDQLYPLLAYLEGRGHVESGWADPDSPYPRRRGYKLTAAGAAYCREVHAEEDPRCPWCGGKPSYRRQVHGHPCANHEFHTGRGW